MLKHPNLDIVDIVNIVGNVDIVNIVDNIVR